MAQLRTSYCSNTQSHTRTTTHKHTHTHTRTHTCVKYTLKQIKERTASCTALLPSEDHKHAPGMRNTLRNSTWDRFETHVASASRPRLLNKCAVITCKPHRLSRIGCVAVSFVGQPLRSCSAPSGLPFCARFRSHGTDTEQKHERPTGSEPPTGNSDHRRGGGGWVGGNRLPGMAWQNQVSGWGKLGGMFVFEWCDAPG